MLKKAICLLFFTFGILDAGVVRLYDETTDTKIGLQQLSRGMGKEDVGRRCS